MQIKVTGLPCGPEERGLRSIDDEFRAIIRRGGGSKSAPSAFGYAIISSRFSLSRSDSCIHYTLGMVVATCAEPRHRQRICHPHADVGSSPRCLHVLRTVPHSHSLFGFCVARDASHGVGISPSRWVRDRRLSLRLVYGSCSRWI